MRVSVFAVVPRQEPLLESATAAAERRAPTLDIRTATLPKNFEADPNYPAVPIGDANPAGMALESVQAQASEKFVVRGFVETESLQTTPAEIDGNPIFADPQIAPFAPTCVGSPAVGNAALVASKLNVAGLAAKGLTGKDVAVAILDTGINMAHLTAKLGFQPKFDAANSWMAPGNPVQPGQHPVGHGTMCAFDVLIAAKEATLLDFPILAGSLPGGSAVGRFLSVAFVGFAQLVAFWAVAYAPTGAQKYKALVVNNSWGIFHPSWDFPAGHPGRYIDNPNHPFNLLTGTLARSRCDILFAAGNCGAQCPDGRCQGNSKHSIVGANALRDVLTIAGCDTNDQRVGYSSQGPAIPGMYNQKPDITSYTHFDGSGAYPGQPDSGTSAACPVAAGCVAALRTKIAPAAVPPGQLFDKLRAHARRVGGTGGWNGDYGFGIVDPVATATSLGF